MYYQDSRYRSLVKGGVLEFYSGAFKKACPSSRLRLSVIEEIINSGTPAIPNFQFRQNKRSMLLSLSAFCVSCSRQKWESDKGIKNVVSTTTRDPEYSSNFKNERPIPPMRRRDNGSCKASSLKRWATSEITSMCLRQARGSRWLDDRMDANASKTSRLVGGSCFGIFTFFSTPLHLCLYCYWYWYWCSSSNFHLRSYFYWGFHCYCHSNLLAHLHYLVQELSFL